MSKTGQVETTVTLEISRTDLYAILKKMGWEPAGWNFYSVDVQPREDGCVFVLKQTLPLSKDP